MLWCFFLGIGYRTIVFPNCSTMISQVRTSNSLFSALACSSSLWISPSTVLSLLSSRVAALRILSSRASSLLSMKTYRLYVVAGWYVIVIFIAPIDILESFVEFLQLALIGRLEVHNDILNYGKKHLKIYCNISVQQRRRIAYAAASGLFARAGSGPA